MERSGSVRGFSLIEVLVYMAVFIAMSAIVITAIVGVRKALQTSKRLAERSQVISNFLMLKDLLEAAAVNRGFSIAPVAVDDQGRIALAGVDPFSPALADLATAEDGFYIRGCEGGGSAGFLIVKKSGEELEELFNSCDPGWTFTPYYRLAALPASNPVILYSQEGKACIMEQDFSYCLEENSSFQLEMLDSSGAAVASSLQASYIGIKLMPWEASIAVAIAQ